jgi:hypothetical protein
MAVPLRLALAAVGLGLTACQAPFASNTPQLAKPTPNVEVVAVSSEIASPGRPVFYLRDLKEANRLLAYDWAGVPRGSLTVSSSEPYGVYPSADGTMLLLMHASVVSGGRSVGHTAIGSWAGDNAHLCAFLNRIGGSPGYAPRQLGPNTFENYATPGTLFYESVDGSTRRVLDYGQFGSHGGPTVLACSAANDRAVVGGSFVAQVSGLEVIRLSDGKVVGLGPSRSPTGTEGVTVSADARLIALGSAGGISVAGGADGFSVYRLPDNTKIAHITGGGLRAFSADDTRALIVEDVGGSNERQRYQLIDLATSRSLWSAVLSPGIVLSRPGSGDFLVGSTTRELSATRANAYDSFEDLWLIAADGSARLLLKRVSPVQ